MVLYCDGIYIEDFDEFVLIVKSAMAGDKRRNRDLQQEVLALFSDEVLQDWLYEHDHPLAQAFADLHNRSLTDSDLISEIASLCEVKDAKKITLSFDDYLELLPEFDTIIDGQSKTSKFVPFIQKADSDNVRLRFGFKVKRAANEMITISLKLIRKDDGGFDIDSRKETNGLTSVLLHNKGEIHYISYDVSKANTGDKIVLVSGDKNLHEFKIIQSFGKSSQVIIANKDSNIFDVYDIDMNRLVSDLKRVSATPVMPKRPVTDKTDYMIGYSANDAMIYFISKNNITPLHPCDRHQFSILEVYSYYVGPHNAFSLFIEKNNVGDYVVEDFAATPLMDFMLGVCTKYNLPYFQHPLTDELYSVPDFKRITISGYGYVAYIGADLIGPLFLAKRVKTSDIGEIVRIDGRQIATIRYNYIAYPTLNKDYFIAINRGSKYSKWDILSVKDGLVVKSYRLDRGSVACLPENITPTSITIDDYTKYLFNAGAEGEMIDYEYINSDFYFKRGYHRPLERGSYGTEPQLYTSADILLFPIDPYFIFSNRKYEDLGCDFLAVKRIDKDEAIVVLSPEGKIVYTLRAQERIECPQTPMRLSENAFVVEKGNLHKVISYSGDVLFEYKTNRTSFCGFHANMAYYYTTLGVCYFDSSGTEHKIPMKNIYIASIDVLSNGNVKIQNLNNGHYCIIDIHGHILLDSEYEIEILE